MSTIKRICETMGDRKLRDHPPDSINHLYKPGEKPQVWDKSELRQSSCYCTLSLVKKATRTTVPGQGEKNNNP